MEKETLKRIVTMAVRMVTLRRELLRHNRTFADMNYVERKEWWSGLDSEGESMLLEELERLGLVEEVEALFESEGLIGPRRSLERLGLIEAQ